MKHKLLGMFLAFGVFAANAADFYVDAKSRAETPDGSQASPYKTIVEAVNAANEKLTESNVIYIHGGEGRKYIFSSTDDLITIKAANTTLCAWPDTGKPLLELASDLNAKVSASTGKSPRVFAVDENARPGNVVFRNLRFTFYSGSLGGGSSKDGRIIDVYNDGVMVDACEFEPAEELAANSGLAMVFSEEPENNKNGKGANIIVKNCIFKNIANMSKDGSVVRTGTGSKVHNNCFIDCGTLVFPLKKSDSADGFFVSNKVVNCSAPFSSAGGNYGEVPDAELAYNIFVFSNSGIDFFLKKTRGFTGKPKIHHNTIVGARNFITVENYNFRDGRWTPWIFDNLIILAGEGSVICENVPSGTTINEEYKTSFKEGSFLNGNVYFSEGFSSGTATAIGSYSLEDGLNIGDNQKILQLPEFIETEDVFSADYYRLNSVRYPWVLAAARGADGCESTFVGALEPVNEASGNGEFFQVDSFVAEKMSDTLPMRVRYSVAYSQNIGAVSFFWDCDGDGDYEIGPIEDGFCEFLYEKGGEYEPQVKLVDSATGKEIFAKLSNNTIKIKISEVYVDSAAPEGGCGTAESPVKTIGEGVAICADGGTINVRGGDRIYLFDSPEDAIVISALEVTLKPWGEFGRPLLNVAKTFGSEATPSVITVAETAVRVCIFGLEFVYDDGDFGGVKDGDISAQGHILDIWGNKCVIESCVFNRESESLKGESYAVYAHAGEHIQQYGMDMEVRNCRFKGCMKTIHCGKNPIMEKNRFECCSTIFYSLKSGNCEFSFVSNRLFECKSLNFNGGSHQEMPRGEISYNIFVTSTGTSFIQRESYGFSSERSLIHHNTIVGSTNLAHITKVGIGSFDPWCPRMHDNLIVLGKDGVLFREDGDVLKDTHSSSFKTNGGATFNNNAYLSSETISIGTATELEGYDLSKGLTIEKNYILTEAPRFVSTDLESPDFYRLKSRKGDWAFATATGGYPNYVGAIEPQLIADGFSIVVR